MNFSKVIEKFSKMLDADCDAITEIINQFKSNFKNPTHALSLNAFDKVICVTPSPDDLNYKFSELSQKGGVYIFVMKDDCDINQNFNVSGKYRAKLRDPSNKISCFSRFGKLLWRGNYRIAYSSSIFRYNFFGISAILRKITVFYRTRKD